MLQLQISCSGFLWSVIMVGTFADCMAHARVANYLLWRIVDPLPAAAEIQPEDDTHRLLG